LRKSSAWVSSQSPEVYREAVRELDRQYHPDEEADVFDGQERVVAPRLQQRVGDLEDHVGEPERDRERATTRVRARPQHAQGSTAALPPILARLVRETFDLVILEIVLPSLFDTGISVVAHSGAG